jgi:hypothetical protein
MGEAFRIEIQFNILLEHLTEAEGKVVLMEEAVELLESCGLKHHAGHQWIAEDVSLNALHRSEYKVLQQIA